MNLYPKEFIEELKSRLNIVEVISRYVTGMTKKGKSYFACCPFHHEKTPSFSVNEYEQFYYCFGCGKSGDLIRFIEEIDNVEYADAVAILAKYANMSLPQLVDDGGKQAALKQKKDKLYAIIRLTAQYYHERLKSRGGAALAYLKKRLINDNLITRFGIGYSPDFDGLVGFLKKAGYDEDAMIESGAVSRTQNGSLMDAMALRVVFPIINSYDDVIGFSGRILENKEGAAKYKNTGATPIFDKSRNLYGVNLLKKERRQNGINDVILVEGHIDLVSLSGAGIKNAVAGMGTAFTKYQAALIKRYSDKVYIAYDGDKAGQSAALRGLDILAAEGLDVRVMSLPDGSDPDDIINKRGKEYFLELKEKALPLYEYKIIALSREFDLDSNDERGKFAKKAVGLLSGLDSAVLAEAYAGLISELSGISRGAIQREFDKTADINGGFKQNNNNPAPARDSAKRRGKYAEQDGGGNFDGYMNGGYADAYGDGDYGDIGIQDADARGSVKKPTAAKKAARFILNSFLFKKPYADAACLDEIGDCFDDASHAAVSKYIAECQRRGIEPRVSALYDEMESTPEVGEIVNFNGGFLNAADGKKYFDDSVAMLKREKINAGIEALKRDLDGRSDIKERALLTAEIGKLLKLKNKYKR
ncbi:MAG: DNA primase [Clostridiales bacterium]|jgi:DNA primase|nr:DNA primase [Clostridiales bacterium]